MDAVVQIVEVDRRDTQKGNTRFTVKDDEGREYVTFRPPIGEAAERCLGKTARIEFHEETRGQYHNVYLDAVELLETGEPAEPASARDNADAVAWEAAAEAAPLLVGTDRKRSADELFEALKPFKDRVADDIRRRGTPHVDRDEEPTRPDSDRDEEPTRPDNVTHIRKRADRN